MPMKTRAQINAYILPIHKTINPNTNKKYFAVSSQEGVCQSYIYRAWQPRGIWLCWIVQWQDEEWVAGKGNILICERSTGFDWDVVQALQYDQTTKFTQLPATSSSYFRGSIFSIAASSSNIVSGTYFGGRSMYCLWEKFILVAYKRDRNINFLGIHI